MFGVDTGSLAVTVEATAGGWTELWNRTGPQHASADAPWTAAQVLFAAPVRRVRLASLTGTTGTTGVADLVLYHSGYGEWYVMGRNDQGQLGLGHAEQQAAPQHLPSPNGVPISAVALGAEHMAFIAAGQLFVCGSGAAGQLGLGLVTNQCRPRYLFAPNAQAVTEVAAASYRTAFVAGGALFVTGRSNFQQLGFEGVSQLAVPLQLVPPDSQGRASAVSLGQRHTAMVVGGRAYVTGSNNRGQLRLGHSLDAPTPVPVPSPDAGRIARVRAGYTYTAFMTDRDPPAAPPPPRPSSGQWYVMGANAHGQLGLGPQTNVVTPQPLAAPNRAPIRAFAAGLHHSAFVAGGQLFVMGSNEDGQLGLGHRLPAAAPQLLEAPNGAEVELVALGQTHSAFVAGGALYTMGANGYGQLGLGDYAWRLRPERVAVPDGRAVTAVSLGPSHGAFLAGGRAYVFGQALLGLAADPATPTLLQIPQLPPFAVAAVACGDVHTAFLTSWRPCRTERQSVLSATYCEGEWAAAPAATGADFAWQPQDAADPAPPVPAGLTYPRRFMYATPGGAPDPAKVAYLVSRRGAYSGIFFKYRMYGADAGSLAVAVETAAGGWTAVWRQAGPQPRAWEDAEVAFASTALRVRLQSNGNAAVAELMLNASTGGELWVFGRTTGGRMGIGFNVGNQIMTEPEHAASFGGMALATVAAGPSQTAGVSRGRLYVTGSNSHGEIGLGTIMSVNDFFPVDAPNGGAVVAVALGQRHSAFLADGELFVMGGNEEGQLGLGHRLQRDTPQHLPSANGRAVTAVAVGGYHTAFLAEATFTPTPTLSVTPTRTPTGTLSGTGTPTRTLTPVASATGTASGTHSHTRSVSATRSSTPATSATPSQTLTPSLTPSPTQTLLPTSTRTYTATGTATATAEVPQCSGGGGGGGGGGGKQLVLQTPAQGGKCIQTARMGRGTAAMTRTSLLVHVVRLAGTLKVQLQAGCQSAACVHTYTAADVGTSHLISVEATPDVQVLVLYDPPAAAANRRQPPAGARAASDEFLVETQVVHTVAAGVVLALALGIALPLPVVLWLGRRRARRMASKPPPDEALERRLHWLTHPQWTRPWVFVGLVLGLYLVATGGVWVLVVLLMTSSSYPSAVTATAAVVGLSLAAAGAAVVAVVAVAALREETAHVCPACHEPASMWRCLGTRLPADPEAPGVTRKGHARCMRCQFCGRAMVGGAWRDGPAHRPYHAECWAQHCRHTSVSVPSITAQSRDPAVPDAEMACMLAEVINRRNPHGLTAILDARPHLTGLPGGAFPARGTARRPPGTRRLSRSC